MSPLDPNHSTRPTQPTGVKYHERFHWHWTQGRFNVHHDQRLEHPHLQRRFLVSILFHFFPQGDADELFLIKSAILPCEKWIVTGSLDQKTFLYNVSNESRNFDVSSWEGKRGVIELEETGLRSGLWIGVKIFLWLGMTGLLGFGGRTLRRGDYASGIRRSRSGIGVGQWVCVHSLSFFPCLCLGRVDRCSVVFFNIGWRGF